VALLCISKFNFVPWIKVVAGPGLERWNTTICSIACVCFIIDIHGRKLIRQPDFIEYWRFRMKRKRLCQVFLFACKLTVRAKNLTLVHQERGSLSQVWATWIALRMQKKHFPQQDHHAFYVLSMQSESKSKNQNSCKNSHANSEQIIGGLQKISWSGTCGL